MFEIEKFNDSYESIWDHFVLNESINGTIYHTRTFLKYHGERFPDESILVFFQKRLICVLPCCRDGSSFFSHKGSTYGGPVFHTQIYNTKYLPSLIETILSHYEYKIQFRISNSIYHAESDSFLIYLLSRHLRLKLELSWYIKTDQDFMENMKNKRTRQYIQQLLKDPSFCCAETTEESDYIDFYHILEKNLKHKYHTTPTHSLKEFWWLKENLTPYQSLFIAKKNNIIHGGVFVMKTNKRCWYTFYISRNIDIPVNHSITLIMLKIQEEAKKQGISFVDFGICTENQGDVLNTGLSDYKEHSLGGIPSYRFLFLLPPK